MRLHFVALWFQLKVHLLRKHNKPNIDILSLCQLPHYLLTLSCLIIPYALYLEGMLMH